MVSLRETNIFLTWFHIAIANLSFDKYMHSYEYTHLVHRFIPQMTIASIANNDRKPKVIQRS